MFFEFLTTTDMTTLDGHTCPFCSCREVLYAKPREKNGIAYSVWSCRTCGFGETFPQADDAMLHALHSIQYYRNREGVRFVKPVEFLIERTRWWRIHRLSQFVTIGRALDIGCGSGQFLHDLRGRGWDVAGLELNTEIASTVSSIHGFAVETNLDAFENESFDLITITHVLEHVRDPRAMLTQCSRLLRPGGIIAVAVPNLDSWQARLTRENWFHLDVPRHLWHFSENWLSKTVQSLGFAPVAVRRLGFAQNTFGWLQSLLNMMGVNHNRLYKYLSSDDLKKESLRSSSTGLFASIILSPFLLPLSVMLAVLESLFHAGGTVEIIARIHGGPSPDPKH
jgi:2-polyprenyl-3-methyl-5-hydroxy-6-metoxy-1,4-benzoquinol methylase